MSRNPRYENEPSPDQLTWHDNPNTDPAYKGAGCLIIPAALGTAALIGFGATSTFEASAPQPEIIEKGDSANELFEDNTIAIETQLLPDIDEISQSVVL